MTCIHQPISAIDHCTLTNAAPFYEVLPIDALLRLGDRDNDVKALQRILRSLGYQLEIDGRFGRITLECVKSFQASHGLIRDGVVGPMTWTALQEASAVPAFLCVLS